MAFSLSFADGFFYPAELETVLPSHQPTSVYQSLMSLRDETWQEIAREVFDVDPDRLDVDAVMDRIRQTDTCTDLTPPVEVWIDEDGWYRIEVYDERDP